MGKSRTIAKSLLDKRKGYRLTEEAYEQVSWTEDNPCYCSACSMPPCASCENGLPEDVAYEYDEYWEIDPDYEEEDMPSDETNYLYKKGDTVERIGSSVTYVVKGKHYKVARDQIPSGSRRLYIINDKGEEDHWEASNFKLISKASDIYPVTEWFGFKYKVNPETSRLLQEAVFKDGGQWGGTRDQQLYGLDNTYLHVTKEGDIWMGFTGESFGKLEEPEKQPPQPEVTKPAYKFKAGDKVRVTAKKGGHRYEIGDITYLVDKPSSSDGQWGTNPIKGKTNSANQSWVKEIEFELVVDKEDEKEDNGSFKHTAYVQFDGAGKLYAYKLSDEHYQLFKGNYGVKLEVETPSNERRVVDLLSVRTDYLEQKATKEIKSVYSTGYKQEAEAESAPLPLVPKWELTKINLLTKQEETIMTQTTKRRVLNIQLLDNDAGLPVEFALVAAFEGVVTEDTDEVTIQELISNGEVAGKIKIHNEVRAEQVNLDILNRTGNEVKLLPIKLKNLTWNIK